MPKEQILQDVFLNTLCKNREMVNVYLINGIRMRGRIEAFDRFVVMIRESSTRMVYKHAISTIAPIKETDAPAGDGNAEPAGDAAGAAKS